MKRGLAWIAAACLLLPLSGCCILLENNDPFNHPVTVEFDVEPTDQPNPGTLQAGQAAEINFPNGTKSVTANGFDPINPEFEDTIRVDLPSDRTLCRHLEWDGFEFHDLGTVNASRLVTGLLTGKVQVRLTK